MADDSLCRDEVVYAILTRKTIVPLRVHGSQRAVPTLLLARRNWVDFSSDYDAGLSRLLEYLSGDDTVLLPPVLPAVMGLPPLDFSVELAKYSQGFVGREWLIRRIDSWLRGSPRRASVLVGEPGAGKSAFAAWLAVRRPDLVIGAYFCTQQNTRTRVAREFVAALVAQLHTRLPGFADALSRRDLGARRRSASDAFREAVREERDATKPHLCREWGSKATDAPGSRTRLSRARGYLPAPVLSRGFLPSDQPGSSWTCTWGNRRS